MDFLELFVVLEDVGVEELDLVVIGDEFREVVHRHESSTRQELDQISAQINFSQVDKFVKSVVG